MERFICPDDRKYLGSSQMLSAVGGHPPTWRFIFATTHVSSARRTKCDLAIFIALPDHAVSYVLAPYMYLYIYIYIDSYTGDFLLSQIQAHFFDQW